MHCLPYTILRSISELLPSYSLAWLTHAGNVETKKLRDEIVLEARDAYEYESYLADVAEREYWGERSPRRPTFETESESEEYREPEGPRAPRAFRFRTFDPDDPCDHYACLWRRWAGDD